MIPFPSFHRFLLSPLPSAPLSSSPSPSILLVLSRSDLFSSLCLSYPSRLFDSLNLVRFLSPVCLSLTSVKLLILRLLHCVTLQSVPSPPHIPSTLHLLSYKQVPAVCRLHGFLSSSFRSCPLSYTSLSNLPFTLPLSPLLLLLPLSGNRCCLSDLIITG